MTVRWFRHRDAVDQPWRMTDSAAAEARANPQDFMFLDTFDSTNVPSPRNTGNPAICVLDPAPPLTGWTAEKARRAANKEKLKRLIS
jgi:hypothetical protein